MLTDKPKRKNLPRLCRILIAVVIVTLLMLGGLVAFPYAEIRLNQWLENDPFTPMCNASHLELAYEGDDDYGWARRVYLIRGDSSNKVAVTQRTTDPVHYFPYWSTDGQWLSFNRYYDVTFEGSSILNRITQEEAHFMEAFAAWSPDGKYIQSIDLFSDGLILDIRNPFEPNSPVHIVHTTSFASPLWSPDGSRIIYGIMSEDNPELEKTVIAYSTENFDEVILHDGSISSIGWSPNGQYFLFAADNLLWVAEFDQNTGHLIEVRQLASAMVSSLRWSWDSTQIAYFVEAGRAVIQQVDTGEIVWRFNAEFLYDWSENGLIIGTIDPMYPYTPASQILELRVANVVNQTIDGYFARTTGYTNATAQWTPDGQQIFYTFDYSDFFLTTPESDPDGVLADFHIPSSNLDFGAMWTPDHQYLTYEGDNHWLYLLKLDTHESCRVVKGNTQAPTNYNWRLIPEAEG